MADKIETRKALVEWLELWDFEHDGISWDGAEAMLDALDAAGVVPCPKEPTTEMMEAAVVAETDQIAAAIANSPYRREP